MKRNVLLLAVLVALPAAAGDLWEFSSSSTGPEGAPVAYTQRQCFPKDGVDPAQVLGGAGSCTLDQKSGSASSMTFSMTCKTPGMPAELGSMIVSGDARLDSDRFDMRYTMSVGGNRGAPGGDFRMTGSLQGRRVGECSER